MRNCRGFFVVLACFSLLFLPSLQSDSLAACQPFAQIDGVPVTEPTVTTVQGAYDYASNNLGLANFELKLSGDIFTENLTLNGGNVTFDGGYDCSFTSKTSSTSIFGSITVGSGAINFADGVGIVSTDQCSFNNEKDRIACLEENRELFYDNISGSLPFITTR